ncbi:ferrochelatase [Candidatus Profftia tarda]|nr:ferrochelatase [Candidatus Profftia tarda]
MKQEKIGVLLVNLGTPDAPTTVAVKRYLAEFLKDKRVVDSECTIWKLILYFIILPLRCPRAAKRYKSIWTKDGSPLMFYSYRQHALLKERLPNITIELGMRYGQPALKHAINKLSYAGVDRMILLPLYPQYSCSTNASVFDSVARHFANMRRIPSLTFIRDYAEHPAYIDALSATIRSSFVQYGKPDMLIFSFHGIPQSYADQGDDYPERCNATVQAVVDQLGLHPKHYMMTYQSRFGHKQWLAPFTDKTISQLPGKGVKHLQVICPGFSVDCLETLEEIKFLNKQLFIKAGGKSFRYIPALNDNTLHIDLLYQLLVEQIRYLD